MRRAGEPQQPLESLRQETPVEEDGSRTGSWGEDWAWSSPRWRQKSHFNITRVFKLQLLLLAAPSQPTLHPALGLLKVSRLSSVLAVNWRKQRSKSTKSLEEEHSQHGVPDPGAICASSGCFCCLSLLRTVSTDGLPSQTAACCLDSTHYASLQMICEHTRKRIRTVHEPC